MSYSYLSALEFEYRYQLLAGYIKANENERLPDIEAGLNNLPNNHGLKDKSLFVLNEEGKSFLHKAAAEGNLLLITFLKETGHEIDRQDHEYKTPLYDACAELKLASVNALLGYGANPNLGDDHIPFKSRRKGKEVAYQGENVPLVAVIESTATVTAAEFVAAWRTGEDLSGLTDEQATKRAAATIVKKLIEEKANLLLQTGKENYSALHRAINHRKRLLVKEIADSGPVDIFRQFDRDGEAALHMVVAYRNKAEKEDERTEMQEEKDIADIIISHTESISVQEPEFGNTPLHAAVICSNVDVVKAIYKNDYKFFSDLKILSIQNKEGNTAIHEAVKEAWRGPKILNFLIGVATEEDLAVVNNAGETAGEIAERLLSEANPVHDLVKEVKVATENLELILDGSSSHEEGVKAQAEIEELYTAIKNLEEHVPFDDRKSDDLGENLDVLSANLENYKDQASLSVEDAEDLVERSRTLIADTKEQFFHKSYLDSLKSVKQEKYFAWKSKQLQLPSSFPNLETIDSRLLNEPKPPEPAYEVATAMYNEGVNAYNQGDYSAAIDRLKTSVDFYKPLYSSHRALANAYRELANAYLAQNNNINVQSNVRLVEDNNLNAQINIEEGIEIYHTLKEYELLEQAYQTLAKTYIFRGELSIANYEQLNRNKLLSLNNQEKLQGHLALAGLYKELREQAFVSPLFSMNDLQAHESFHFYQVYKLSQGNLDNSAHVVLQREMGIANNANLGTYNIQQCVAVVAFEPISKKVVLSHFDKFSGPASFIEQLLHEFPGRAKIDLYISGGRDRSSNDRIKISDNNIDQVLKQIHAKNVEDSADGDPENGRFRIKACDVDINPSPEAIVFDVQSQRLVHAMPDLADSSLESRAVSFLLQKNKADYLRPLNSVDFTHATNRAISFTPEQNLQIEAGFTGFTKRTGETDAWNHQIFYPLMIMNNEIQIAKNNQIARINTDFTQGLLTERLNSLSNHYRGVPLVNTNQPSDDNLVMDDDDLNEMLRCLGSKRKREAHCVLDSEHILESLKGLDAFRQSEMLQHVATRTVGGTKQKEMAKLVHNEKTMNHLQKVGKFSSCLMDDLFAEGAIVDLFKGDPKAAINLGGLKGLSHVLKGASKLLDEEGMGLLAEGKIFRAKLLRAGAPIVNRGAEVLVVSDFYNQIKALQKDSNNTEALVGAVSDGILLTTDVITAGIEVAEISSETMALMGISAATGPAGEIIGAFVMLGDKIYEAEEKVAAEDRSVHLTAWEKFKEGCLAFADLEPEAYIKKMTDEVGEYARILPKKLEFLKSNPNIKHLIFPAIEKTGESCRVVQVKPWWGCGGGGPMFPPKDCYVDETLCDPVFADVKDNAAYFRDKLIGFKLTREEITPPAGSQLLCVPTAESDGKALPVGGAYACDGAIGLTYTNNTAGTVAFYDFGEGKDHAAGFNGKLPGGELLVNVFIVNNGAKDYAGGEGDDIYIVRATEVETALNPEGEVGGLNGEEGIDSLLLQGFVPLEGQIEVNLNEGYLRAGNRTLLITSIERLVGGSLPLFVTAGCDTKEIDSQGGPTVESPDTLLIPENDGCDHEMKLYLKPNAVLRNEARQGNFTYYILPGTGMVSVNLTSSVRSNETSQLSSGRLTHQFVFNATVSDVSALSLPASAATEKDKLSRTINVHFLDHKIRKLLRTIQTISIEKINATLETTIHYQLKPGSDAERSAWLPAVLQQTQSQAILKKHRVDSNSNFNITLSKRHEIRDVILTLLKNSSSIDVDNFKLALESPLSSNTLFHFIDGVELKLGDKNSYLIHTTDQSVDDIMKSYVPVVARLKVICIIQNLQKERVIISRNGQQVMHNDPGSYKTHLNGNGRDLFVMKSKTSLSESRLPLSETVLYPTDTGYTDTLDFRPLVSQIKTEFNATAKLLFVTPNKKNKLGNDILLILGMTTQSTPKDKVIEIITVRLKEAWLTHWHKKYLQVILNVAPQQIVGSRRNLRLKPISLKLDTTHEFVSVGVDDVEENTEIIIPKASNQGNFFHHNKTNLIWTNMLSDASEMVDPCAIILKDFYKEPTLATLSFIFSDKKVVLNALRQLAAINVAANFDTASDERKEFLKKESLAIIAAKQLQLPKENQNASVIESLLLGNDSRTQVAVDTEIERYSGEESEEADFNQSNLIRQRRFIDAEVPLNSAASTPGGILQTVRNALNHFIKLYPDKKAVKPSKDEDAVQDRANAYHEQYDRMQSKPRVKRSGNKASRTRFVAQRMHRANDPVKAPVASSNHVDKATAFKQAVNVRYVPHKADFFAKVAKPSFLHKHTQGPSVVLRESKHLHKQSVPLKPSHIKASLFKAIPNKSEHYFQPSAKEKLSGSNHQSHQQHAKSGTGISHVTASADPHTTLFLINYMVRRVSKEKYKPFSIPKVVTRRPQVGPLMKEIQGHLLLKK